MEDEQDLAVPTVEKLLLDYNQQLRLARATDLAKSGRFMEAEAMLCPFDKLPNDEKELDLLARIAAKQKLYERATSLWKFALKKCPGNDTYERALECVKHEHENQKRLKFTAKIGMLAVSVVAISMFGWSFVHLRSVIDKPREEAKPNKPEAAEKPKPSVPAPTPVADPNITPDTTSSQQPALSTPAPTSSPTPGNTPADTGFSPITTVKPPVKPN